MGRIEPVEYVGVSQQRNGNVRNIIHPHSGQCRQLKDDTVLWKENNC